MNPYLIIAALIAFIGAAAGGFKLGMDHQIASEADKKEMVEKAVDAANHASAEAIASLKPIYTTIQSKVQHEVETHTVYIDCKLPASGLQLVNQALNGGKPASDSKLPQADSPK